MSPLVLLFPCQCRLDWPQVLAEQTTATQNVNNHKATINRQPTGERERERKEEEEEKKAEAAQDKCKMTVVVKWGTGKLTAVHTRHVPSTKLAASDWLVGLKRRAVTLTGSGLGIGTVLKVGCC